MSSLHAADAPELRLSSAAGRWVVAATALGSGLASLDATVVNIALPSIGRELQGGLASLQWIASGYTLSLAAWLLLGGALGDRYGRRRVFLVGMVWFTLASMACGLATSTLTLVLARVLQGVGGALLTPGSLAILTASFRAEDRAPAIGAWSAFSGVGIAIGPFVGGYLIQAVSWRLIFFINLPLAIVAGLLARRFVPETRAVAAAPLDVAGAILASLGLGGLTYGLIAAGERGPGTTAALIIAALGVLVLVAFLVVQSRRAAPMLDLRLFRHRPFGAANLQTLLVYASLGGSLLFLPLQLQTVLGYTPLAAGAALLPTTGVMLLLSSAMGRLAQRIGPRWPMTGGPVVAAVGLALLAAVDGQSGYLSGVLPGVTVLGLGLAITVAPLTATVLAAAPPEHAGVASAINNAAARTGTLLAVAVLPVAAGLAGGSAFDSVRFARGYPRALLIAACGCLAGAAVAFLRIKPAARVATTAWASCPLDGPALAGADCLRQPASRAP